MNTEDTAGQQAQSGTKYDRSTLPEFKSHKCVKAMRIDKIVDLRTGIFELITHNESAHNTCIVIVNDAYMGKHKPTEGGYYVLYADGYESFSPAKAFEEGYLQVRPMMADGVTDLNAQDENDEARTFPPGTLLHMGGIPVTLTTHSTLRSHAKNWPLALERLETDGSEDVNTSESPEPARLNAHGRLAMVAHEINRAYCQAIGDNSQPSWEDAPDWQKNSAFLGVELHLNNPDAGPQASHESWMKQKESDGWKYGPIKNPELKEHPCMVPFDQLPREQQAKDYLFRAVVHAVKDVL